MCRTLVYEPDDTLYARIESLLGKELTVRLKAGEPLPVFTDQAPVVILDGRMKWSECRDLLDIFDRRSWPVLFATDKREVSAHLRALYSSPCDVILIPFTQKELKRRITSLYRQAQPVRELSLDENAQAALLDGERVDLTAQEFSLLSALMETPGAPQSREQLLRTAWGYQSIGDTRTVDVHVQRLRKKLGDEFIETVYKCGYRLKLA